MTRFLFINTTISWNKGSAAQVISTMNTVRELIPDAEFSLLSYCLGQDRDPGAAERVDVVGYPDDGTRRLGSALRPYVFRLLVCITLALMRRLLISLGLKGDFVRKERFCRTILESDIVIDLSGDSLSDRGAHSFVNLLGMLAVTVLGRPFICYSQSIGPFSRFTRPMVRVLLARAEEITVRESISRDMVLGLGVPANRIHLHGDCAFVLPAASGKAISEILRSEGVAADPQHLVGVSVSSLMLDLLSRESSPNDSMAAKYRRVLVRFVDDMTAGNETRVILVPHVISPRHWMNDDRVACEIVHREVRRPDMVHTIHADLTAKELKGIIGRCEFFVGSRMHACIAALSQGIPTVTIGWSHKYDGIMHRLAQDDLVLNLIEIGEEELLHRLRGAYETRDHTSKSLSDTSRSERESAKSGGDVIVGLVNRLSPHD